MREMLSKPPPEWKHGTKVQSSPLLHPEINGCTMALWDPNLSPSSLQTPQHTPIPWLYRCAELLLKHGATIDLPSEDSGETALHVAAKHGLYDHAHLYLKHGAEVDARSTRGETALGLVCRQAPDAVEDALQLCRLLVVHGAKLDARDELQRSPLHEACGAANNVLVKFLLRRGADVNAIDYNGISPLGCVLQAAAFKQELRPHLVVQLLLNYGSQKIWPHAFAKVLVGTGGVEAGWAVGGLA